MIIDNEFKIIEGKLPGETWITEDGKKILYLDGPTEKLPSRVDIIISKGCPLSFSPCIIREDEESYEDYMKRLEDRRYLDKVLKEVVTTFWFFKSPDGKSYSGHIGDLLYRAITTSDFIEI